MHVFNHSITFSSNWLFFSNVASVEITGTYMNVSVFSITFLWFPTVLVTSIATYDAKFQLKSTNKALC